jgi:hypothetical protein
MHLARTLSKTAAAFFGFALATASHAAWDIIPQVELSASHDDNLRLLPDDLPLDGGDGAMSLDGRFRAAFAGERGNLFLEPRVRAEQYSDTLNETLNGTDTFFRIRGDHAWTQARLEFALDYDQQDIKDAEVTDAFPDDPDIDDPIDPDTGLLLIDEDRKYLYVGPSLDVQISDRSSLVFASHVLDVSYTGAELDARADFTDTEVSAGIFRQVDDRNEVSARIIGSEYVANLNENVTTTFGVEGTFARSLVRDWSFYLQAGVSRSDYSFLNERLEPVDNADTSFTYNLGFRQRTERNTINIDLARDTSPNSNGFLTLRDELHIYVSRAMTQRVRGEIGLRGYTSETLDDVVANDERDYWRMELAMEWAMSEQLFLNGGFAFTKQQLAEESEDASSNLVWVGLVYRGRAPQ